MTARDQRPYADKLKDPRWQKVRLEVMARDGWTCQQCHDQTSTLHLHHRYYEPGLDPWEYPPDALVTLCEFCHAYETRERPAAEQELLALLRKVGLSCGQLRALTTAIAIADHDQPGHPNAREDTTLAALATHFAHHDLLTILELINDARVIQEKYGRESQTYLEHWDRVNSRFNELADRYEPWRVGRGLPATPPRVPGAWWRPPAEP
jgi:hypothetical protein